MAIMTRLVRIFKADIHGVMDQLEDQGLLVKQYLRDMDEALSDKEEQLKKMVSSRRQVQQEHDKYKRQYEALEQDLAVAIQKDKDDIARMLIKKIKPLDDLRAELLRRIETLDQEISRFNDHLDQQRLRYEQLKHRSAEYFHKAEMREWDKNTSALISDNTTEELTDEEIELELIKRKEALST